VPEDRPGREGSLSLARAALAALEASRSRLDDLNVFPVPDGDTGINMVATARAVVEALERGEDPVRGALMGARGNSGVILSQLLRGAVEAIDGRERIGTAELAAALRAASDAGYAALREPQEGTILTVARALADRAEELAKDGASLEEALGELVAHGEVALARTREQLDVLRQAGVVDAGAAGLLEVIRGIAAAVRGEPLPERPADEEALPLEAVHQELSRYRYCTSFFVEGGEVDPARLETELSRLGDSLLVVGAPGAVKVHLHTDEPGEALALGTGLGVVEEIDIKNMHAQTANRTARLVTDSPPPTPERGHHREVGLTGAVAVCQGDGLKRLFESLGATCLEGGQTMNPATEDLIKAVDALREPGVVLLPNNENVLLAAEQAAEIAAKEMRVTPARSIPAGLGAMVAFDASRPLDENAKEMAAAAASVRSGAVTRATRSATLGPLEVEQGHFLGLVEGEPVTSGPTLEPVAREVVERLLSETADVLTILVGEDPSSVDELVDGLRAAHPELEIEVYEGGQPHYPLLFGVE
jgi:DAK2 domain fusion protein YloV